MNEFLRFILSELKGALGFAIIAAAGCAFVIFLAAGIYGYVKRGDPNAKKFPLGRAVSTAMLLCWVAAVAYLTVMRPSTYGGRANLHLFRAWREAWNNFSFKNWSNVLLNVAMFFPLGALLPLAAKFFRRWYAAIGVFFASTFAIEFTQLFAHRGTFDVDDLFANFLGALIGYGVVTAVLSFADSGEREHRARRAAAALSVPALSVLAAAAAFAVYFIKPYGNLACAPSYYADTRGVKWELSCRLPKTEGSVPLYRAKGAGQDECIEAARSFFERLGVGEEEIDELDIGVYDDGVFVSDHKTASVYVYYADGSRRIEIYGTGSGNAASVAEDEARALLLSYGIEVPEGASFENVGTGAYMFRLERRGDGGVAGWLRIRCEEAGGGVRLKSVADHMCECELCAEEEIISAEEALSRLERGRFDGMMFEYLSPENAEVTSCSLEYETDSKGFFQPVYTFSLICDGENEMTAKIPAMK